MSQEELINRFWKQAENPAFEWVEQSFKPVLVICFKRLTREQHDRIAATLWPKMEAVGWVALILDGFDKMDVRAFGVPESELGTLEELKKLIEDNLNKR